MSSESHSHSQHKLPHETGVAHEKAKPKAKFHVPPEYKRRIFQGVALVIGLYCLWFLYDYWAHEETDNAYVTGHLHYVSPRVSGVVEEVPVHDNQQVNEGDVLLKLDPRDLKADFDEAQANADKAQLDFDRDKELIDINAISKQDLEHAQAALDVAKARLDTARLQLSYTTIVAPASGTVGRKSVEVGNRVQPGQALMVIVSPEVWVVANYKETQLPGIVVGKKAELKVDAIPEKTFTGTVQSFSPASGNQFALLPADNATGNFTKIAQRVPVKIVFDPDSIKGYEDRIRPGLSVIVKIRVH